jgi:hypothetical protein
MTTGIPRIFHFVYGLRNQTAPFHLLHYLAIESCLRVNTPEALLFHFHHEPWGDYWDLIRDKITPVRIARPKVRLRYDDRRVAAYSYAHESDFIRLDVLLEHGGVYADIDTVFIRPVPQRLYGQSFVLGREDDIVCQKSGARRASVCNAFIMSRAGSDFGALWRQRMEGAFDGSWSRHSTILPAELAQAHPDLVHIEPPGTFYPFMWTREDLRRLFEGCECVDRDSASVHLWAHLWWSRRRRDFSDVHADMFTEKYIRATATTLNLLLQPFLPPGARPGRRPAAAVRHAAGFVRGWWNEILSRSSRRFERLAPRGRRP